MKVSRLCLGTMNFARQTPEKETFEIMDHALEMGINFFDTADVYGENRGDTETLIGRWFAQGAGRRDSIILATKVFGPATAYYQRHEENSHTGGLSKYKIIKHCEGSLQRLQTDHIDIYQTHHIDRQCTHQEIWEAMDILQQQGKIVYVGSSNYAGWDLAECCMTTKVMGKQGLCSEQSFYNLNNRMVEMEVVQACLRFGIGIIPWSPLDGGFLGGVLQTSSTGRRASEGMQKKIEKNREKLENYEALCKQLDQSPANIALAWLLHQPVVAAPIIGVRTIEQLKENQNVPDLELSEETLKKLDDLFPGPGQSPETYSWKT